MKEEKLRAAAYIDAHADLFTGVSDTIWEYAELSLREEKSAALYCRVLREAGFSVQENLAGIPTAFSATVGSGRPHIGILGEFDALSGLSQVGDMTVKQELVPGGNGHGCGHNLLGAGALAAAFAVKEYLERTKTPGTVTFFGCPGEEGGAGKAYLARDGAWRSLDAALTWHPGDTNEVTTGTCNSCIQVLYRFHGVASHAAAAPQEGRSALDAVELMNVGVQFLREHMIPEARIHYAILDGGGVSPNVVQPEASVLYMVRAIGVSDAIDLQKRVDKIAEGAALMTETTCDREFIDGTANYLPCHTLEQVLHANFLPEFLPEYTEEEYRFAEELRATFPVTPPHPLTYGGRHDPAFYKQEKLLTENWQKALNDFLVPYYAGEDFTPGSSDVGDVSWQTPTAQFTAVTCPSGTPGHSWQNVSCGVSGIGHKGMLLAGKVLAASVIDLLEEPALLSAARKEFTEVSGRGYECPIPPDAVAHPV